eukprot:PhF_6_TR26294/c0_g1_i1/m.37692
MFRSSRRFLKGDMMWTTFHDGNPQWGAPYSSQDRRLRDDEVADFMKSVKGWTLEQNGSISRKFSFPSNEILYEWMGRVLAFAWFTDKYPNTVIKGVTCDVNIYSGKFNGLSHKEARLAAFMSDQSFVLRQLHTQSENISKTKPQILAGTAPPVNER